MKVLVADDDVTSRRMLSVVLSRGGYEVVEAADGEEALRVLSAPDAPRLAVLDWVMPGMDGVDVCRRLRASPIGDSTYILILTGKSDRNDVVSGLEAGANDYVTKPFDPGELAARVAVGRRVVELQASQRALTEELRLSQERLELALSCADLGLWTWHLESGALEVDDRWKALMGLAGRQVRAHISTWTDVVPPECVPELAEALEQYVTGALPMYEFQHAVPEADRWVRSRGRAAERDGRGKVTRMAGTTFDVTAQPRSEERLQLRSTSDALTGLGNRRAFDDALRRECDRSARTGRPVSLIMLDVDHFKSYNDHHGHLAGDGCLARIASVIRSTLTRTTDYHARWGGEEFAVIVAEAVPAEARAAGERLRAAVESAGIPRSGAHPGVVTVSVGVASSWPPPPVTPDILQGLADEALYAAKRAGRNCVRATEASGGS